MPSRSLALLAFAICSLSCTRVYQVVPRTPTYVLRSPDSREMPFREILGNYSGFEPGHPSVDLQTELGLRVENAYYEKGASRKGLKGYLGTEVANYKVTRNGLQLLSVVPMKNRPEGDAPVQDLISATQMKFHYYRFYFEILFNSKSGEHGSVLLGANSLDELNDLSAQLADPEKVCGAPSTHCSVFPEACSVSLEMNIIVNGKPQLTNWGSLLSSVVGKSPQHLAMKRIYRGRLTNVKIDATDPVQLGLPLLPGDQINWL